MLKTEKIQSLLNTEMCRKDFLKSVGAGVLGLIGFTAFVKNIDSFTQTLTTNNNQTTSSTAYSAYGETPYGG